MFTGERSPRWSPTSASRTSSRFRTAPSAKWGDAIVRGTPAAPRARLSRGRDVGRRRGAPPRRGAHPLVLIQCTDLFESGDSLRNVLHDWKLPIFSVIGYRSFLNQDTLPGDTCLVFTEPLLDAWKIAYRLITAVAARVDRGRTTARAPPPACPVPRWSRRGRHDRRAGMELRRVARGAALASRGRRRGRHLDGLGARVDGDGPTRPARLRLRAVEHGAGAIARARDRAGAARPARVRVQRRRFHAHEPRRARDDRARMRR